LDSDFHFLFSRHALVICPLYRGVLNNIQRRGVSVKLLLNIIQHRRSRPSPPNS
jgi:hypothetical protein